MIRTALRSAALPWLALTLAACVGQPVDSQDDPSGPEETDTVQPEVAASPSAIQSPCEAQCDAIWDPCIKSYPASYCSTLTALCLVQCGHGHEL
ncbi:MAG: hypothetical protein QM820_06035 [Minicystis sp.]